MRDEFDYGGKTRQQEEHDSMVMICLALLWAIAVVVAAGVTIVGLLTA